jgi:hypothetical protein
MTSSKPGFPIWTHFLLPLTLLSERRALVARQAAMDGLAKEIRQGELVVASGARIGDVSLDQGAQA